VATARVILQAHVDDLLLESIPIDAQWPLTAATYSVSRPTLANGDNSFTVPVGARLAILIPPATVTFAKRWKGAGGDTGTLMDQYLTLVMPVVGGQTFIVNSSGLETAAHMLIFI
jgi:hypothetical protein